MTRSEIVNDNKGDDLSNVMLDKMNKKKRMNYIFSLHNGQIIENKLNNVLDEKYKYIPGFPNTLNFFNQHGKQLCFDKYGNIIIQPENFNQDKISEFTKERLIKTNNMIQKIF